MGLAEKIIEEQIKDREKAVSWKHTQIEIQEKAIEEAKDRIRMYQQSNEQAEAELRELRQLQTYMTETWTGLPVPKR